MFFKYKKWTELSFDQTGIEVVFNYSVGNLKVCLLRGCWGDQYRFVLPWCWAAQLADTMSGAVCCSWVLTCAEVCHCAPGPLCHLQHLPWLLVGEASGTITVFWLSAPGDPVCFPATLQCHSTYAFNHFYSTAKQACVWLSVSFKMYHNSMSSLCNSMTAVHSRHFWNLASKLWYRRSTVSYTLTQKVKRTFINTAVSLLCSCGQ